MTLADTFAQVASAAMALDLPALRATIRATCDDGLRAASYDGPGGRSADISSHPERAALNPRHDPSGADLDRITHLETRFTSAIYELATRSHSGPFPQDWRGAVIGARRLHAMDAIATLDRTGLRPARWVMLAGDSVHDLELIARRHLPRQAADWEQSWTSGLADEQCCRLCLAHVNLRVERKAKELCQMHLRLFNEAGGVDPPEWLTAEYRRIGSPAGPDWKRARSRWLQSLGVQDRSAS